MNRVCVLTRTIHEARYVRRLLERVNASADVFPMDEPKAGRRYNHIILTFDGNHPMIPRSMREGYGRRIEDWGLALRPGGQFVHLYLTGPEADKALVELIEERS